MRIRWLDNRLPLRERGNDMGRRPASEWEGVDRDACEDGYGYWPGDEGKTIAAHLVGVNEDRRIELQSQ